MKSLIKTSSITGLTKCSRPFSLLTRRPNELQASFMGTSGTSSATNPFKVFDRSSKLKQKSRAVRKDAEKTRITDYLRDEVSFGLVDRLRDIRRKYDQIVEFGAGPGSLVKPLLDFYLPQKIILTDSCRDLLWRDQDLDPSDVEISRVVMDEELVTLEPESQECIMSSLSLHWVNDLPVLLPNRNSDPDSKQSETRRRLHRGDVWWRYVV
ncbi:hypothetical protein PGTUg99_033771 [Puccinia graminis f. sp. tritici]|uniref:Methyltransferase type 11 domain-containing protein n=1 Tax=Puccinia graminis f. sp. tritici TaxID=56615 RepID=A0A5B0NJP9_PUCGR|nr:hypothetical protein PGTUg99_033771 [Puccinia graminis f. sp. tritici]